MQSEIINAGSPGDNSRVLLNRLGRDVIAFQPSLVILLAGTNDTLNSAALLPLDETMANYSSIIAKLKESGAQTLVATPPPFHEPYLLARHPASAYAPEGPKGRMDRFIASLRRLCGALDIPLVDIHRIFSLIGEIGESPASLLRNKVNSNSEDGIHPTPEGYRVIATALYERLLALDLPRKRIACLGDSITYGINVQGMGTVEGESYPARLNSLLNGGR